MKRFKKALCSLMACSMAVSLPPAALAATPNAPESATAKPAAAADVVTYAVTGGNLYFDTSSGTITQCDTSVTAAVIPASINGVAVISIGEYAFTGCSSLTKIVIPASVTSIGLCVFTLCDSLKSAGPIGSNSNCEFGWTQAIPDHAFDNCTSLTSITIPDSVTSIGNQAFCACSSLTSITIPASVTYIGSNAFVGCSGLKSAGPIGSNSNYEFGWTQTILDGAFSGSDLKRITIPKSVTMIELNAFSSCSNLKDVYYTGNEADWNAIEIRSKEDLAKATIHYNSRGADEGQCGDNARWQVGGSTLTISGTGAIEDFSVHTITKHLPPWYNRKEEITQWVINSGITSIGDSAFEDCSSLTSFTIPDSVISIGKYTFFSCSGLTSITIPKSVIGIDYGAFGSCDNLKDVYYAGSETSWKAIAMEEYNDGLTNATIHFAEPDVNENEGKCGANATWRLEGGTLTISGTGAMYDYTNDPTSRLSPWYDKREEITKVVVNNGITSIGGYAFFGCNSLTSVTISDGVTSIGENAFDSCSVLTKIVIPASVTSIGNYAFINCQGRLTSAGPIGSGADYEFGWTQAIPDYAFQDCSGLTSITIPDSVTSIGNLAFCGCSSLSSITIPDGVTSIGRRAFQYCRDLKSAGPIGSGAEYEFGWTQAIPNYAFEDCSGLTSITIPDGVTSIGISAFDGCSSLTSITIPNSVTSIGSGAFRNCSGLKSAGPVGSNANYEFGWTQAIPDNAFEYCIGLTSITLPDSVTNIGGSAFSGCSGLANITIPDGVTSIGSYAFNNCSSLSSITIPDGVTSIGSYAFNNCSSLSSITIPKSVTSIDQSAFWNCSGLKSAGPIGSNANYEFGWTQAIPDYAFDKCSSLTKIIIPASVTSIGNDAFRNCSGLKSAGPVGSNSNYEFGWTQVIPDRAFLNCSSLTSITLPNSITSIGANVFRYCSSLPSITIPASVTSIGGWTFNGCSSLKDVYYAGSQTNWNAITIGESNTDLTSATIHYAEPEVNENEGTCGANATWRLENGTLTISGTGAMYDYSSVQNIPWYNKREEITQLVVNNGITSIGSNAFLYCSNLTNLTISNSVTSIGRSAFFECSGLTSITIPDGVTSINDDVFDGCSSLTSIIIPDSVTSIGESAFRICSSLTNITIPKSVTSIGNFAFYGCSGLKDVYYSGNKTNWDAVTIGINNENLTNANIHYAEPDVNENEGKCGDNATWRLENGTLTISGTGAMYGYDYTPQDRLPPWHDKRKEITKVVVNNGVTSIGSYAFEDCSNLTSATLSDSVTSIGTQAFWNCKSLTSITIPKNVTYIGINAFYACSSLPNITLPDSITSINPLVFNVCSGLTSITIPDKVTRIGDRAFEGCSGLTSITIPKSVTSINSRAFYACNSLKDVYYSGSKTDWNAINIGDQNESLTNVTIHYSGGGSEDNKNEGTCGTNVKWQLKNGTLTISGTGKMDDFTTSPWYDKRAEITKVVINNGVTSIGEYAFFDCSSMTNITIPKSVTSIGEGSFEVCDGLKDVYYASSKKDWNAVKIINDFHSNDVLLKANIHCVEPEDNKNEGTCGTNVKWRLENGTLTISGTGAMTDFVIVNVGNNPPPWYNKKQEITKVVINNGITHIGKDAFNDCSGLTNITVPKSVTSIGYDAFSDCNRLKDVYYAGSERDWNAINIQNGNEALTSATIHYSDVPSGGSENICGLSTRWQLQNGTLTISGSGSMYDYTDDRRPPWYNRRKEITRVVVNNGVTTIGNCAFEDCSNLTGTSLADSITRIGERAFRYCSRLAKVMVPSRVTSIGYGAFQKCGLTDIRMPDCVNRIGAQAFADCRNLTSIAVPDSVTSIDECTFAGCSSLLGIYLPRWITSIGAQAFENCRELTRITIPAKVTNIGRLAFSGCSGLRSLTIPAKVTDIGDGAFSNCSGLKTLSLPDSLLRIGAGAFSACSGLTSLTVPGSLTSAGQGAFSNCDGLQTVTLAEGATGIYDGMFYHCDNLTGVSIPDSVTSIGVEAFRDCKSLENITIPENVASIGYEAFMDCSSLKGVTLPAGISNIIDQLFSGCHNLTNLNIPDGVTHIKWKAFSGCKGLKSLTIPKSVIQISDDVFESCGSLRDIYYAGSETDWKEIRVGKSNRSLTSITIHYKAVTVAGLKMQKQSTQVKLNDPASQLQSTATVFAAVYDKDGRMLEIVPGTLDKNTMTALFEEKLQANWKLFFMNDTFAPLCNNIIL